MPHISGVDDAERGTMTTDSAYPAMEVLVSIRKHTAAAGRRPGYRGRSAHLHQLGRLHLQPDAKQQKHGAELGKRLQEFVSARAQPSTLGPINIPARISPTMPG